MTARRFHPIIDMDEPMDDTNDSNTSSNSGQPMYHHHLLVSQQNQQQQQQQKTLKRSKMNELVLEYLVHEGFKEAAQKFSKEAGITDLPSAANESMDGRILVKQHIEDGEILAAQSLINTHFPEFLDFHRDIYSRLQQQHLIELIRKQKIDEVLNFVHTHLKVDDTTNLSKMEQTLALLAYEKPEKSPYSNLLEISSRYKLASEINDLILEETLGKLEPTKPQLVTLLKLLFWTQSELETKKIPFCRVTDLIKTNINSSVLNGAKQDKDGH